jgi:hypothetical protein
MPLRTKLSAFWQFQARQLVSQLTRHSAGIDVFLGEKVQHLWYNFVS